ncbi:MAG: hypothetical protein WCD55_01690 [Bacteroidales bacterium]
MTKRFQIFLAFLSLSTAYAFAQQNDSCRVMLKEISGIYDGQCKDGYANGKGTSQGVDTYTGMFKNGLPDGKGKYTFGNGDIFDGFWTDGLKNGPGKFSYALNGKKMILKGYWKNGDYAGTTNPDEYYRITNHTGIESYSIKKIDGKEDQIKISFVGAMTKYVPTGLTVTSSSGNIHKENKNFSIYDFICPNNCSIYFIIRTSGGDRQCYLDFEILKPGKYEVLITNN